MISVTGKSWAQQKVNKNLVEKVKQDYGLDEILSHLIITRNYDSSEIFCMNNSQQLTNIFKNDNDYQKASLILLNIIKKNENICILGDYDVDGSCATSLLVRYFNHINQQHFFYIPDRVKDGYGASKKLFQKLILKKPKLIIMVDCGSTSYEAIDYLNQQNIRSIIIDHHEINMPYPKCDALINPKKDVKKNEQTFLCATALTYFFIDFFIKKNKSDFKLSDFLIYVLLATVCDVMPLRKINKIIGLKVIKEFNIKDNAALNYLLYQNNLKRKITVEDLSFIIGPIINAGGRLNYSNYGVELLSSDDQKIIKDKSIKLIKLNEKRKKIEQDILVQINFEKIKNEKKNVVIYYNNSLNEGLIGIIAARLKDYFNKPAIVITKSNNILKASARSTSIYNIGKLIKQLIVRKIITSGGGHNMAAGFTITKDKINLLDKFIQNNYSQTVNRLHNSSIYEMEISPSTINKKFMINLNKLAPFGNNNLLPIFLIKDVKVIKTNIINNKHISAIIKPRIGSSIKSICFNCINSKISDYLLSYKNRFNIIGQIQENVWNNKKKVQLIIKDIIL